MSLVRGRLASFNIGHLLLILFCLHLFALSFPSDTSNGKGQVFDEAFYVQASRDIIHLVPSNLEHPFFGKIWGALGILTFGDNFFGWRIFYAVIGVLAVWMFYEVAHVFLSKERALFAAAMLGFENIFFIHTSLLLLEGPPILFAMAGFLAYFKKRYYMSALGFGLSILSKEWGIFFLAALILYHLWANWHGIGRRRSFALERWRPIIVFVVIVGLVTMLPLWGYDAVYHPGTSSSVSVEKVVIVDPAANSTTTSTRTVTNSSNFVTNPLQNLQYYFTYQSSLTGCGKTDPWNCYPWMWILPFDVSPLQYYVSTVTVKTTTGTVTQQIDYHPIDWLGMGNLVVWYSIWLVAPILAWRILTRKATQAEVLSACLIAAAYLPFWYISLVSHRVEYAFYFMNVDPGLALGIPIVIGLVSGGNRRTENILMALWLVAAVAFFFLYFPVNPFAFR